VAARAQKWSSACASQRGAGRVRGILNKEGARGFVGGRMLVQARHARCFATHLFFGGRGIRIFIYGRLFAI